MCFYVWSEIYWLPMHDMVSWVIISSWYTKVKRSPEDKSIICVDQHSIVIYRQHQQRLKSVDIISSVRSSSGYHGLLHISQFFKFFKFSRFESESERTHHVLYFWKTWDSRISNMTFPCIKYKIHKYTITQICKYTNTKCLKDPTCAIFFKSMGFKDIKYDIPVCQIHYIYITFTLHLHYIYTTFTLHLHYIHTTFTLQSHYIHTTFTLHPNS